MTTTATAVTLGWDRREPAQVHVRDGFAWDGQQSYLFDIDGTLLRSRDRIHYESFFSSVRTVLGQDLSLEGVVLHGNTDPGILRDAFRVAGIADAGAHPQMEEILEGMRAAVAERRADLLSRVMPGVEAALLHLHRRGAALGVATGNLEVIGWLKIEAAGLRPWFTFGGFSDSYPDRAAMIANAAAIAREVAGPGASVCVVGDTPADIAAARANGLPTIAVATGHYTFAELYRHAPEVCATSLEDLLAATVGPER